MDEEELIGILIGLLKVMLVLFVLMITLIIVIFVGDKIYQIIFPPPKMGGELCTSDDQCALKSCIKTQNQTGYCKLSSKGGVCKEDKNCESGLACRDNNCVTLSQFCGLREFTFFFYIFGILSFIFGLLAGAVGLKLGKIEYGGVTVSGALAGIAVIAFGLWIQFGITC